jgi:uncharacterized phiE125 gp8 family phage protein
MIQERLITAPTDEPLSIAEARMYMRDPEVTPDSEVLFFIRSARRQVEHKTQRAMMPQTWELVSDRFPPYCYTEELWRTYIQLPHPPIQSVTSVTYYDSNNDVQTFAAASYVLDAMSGRVILAPNTSWPSTYGRYDAVVVRYVAGYANADAVPEDIKHYMKLFIEASDKNRSLVQDTVGEKSLTPFAERSLDPYRQPGV